MNAPTALAEGLPRRRFSVADVVRMVEVGLIGEDERLEVLDGEIVPMSAKGVRHESIKIALNDLKCRRGQRAAARPAAAAFFMASSPLSQR